jgi:hypothetical protein
VTFHLANLAVGVVAMVSGVACAIANYFWLHADTGLSRRQMWEHIGGLLFFFILGNIGGGTALYIVLRLWGVQL